jgi:hypothetical protein
MHFLKGKAKNNVRSSKGPGSAVKDKPKAQSSTSAQDKLSKNINIRFMEGQLLCDKREHYRLHKDPNAAYSEAKSLTHHQILELMEPFKKASCDCERRACKSMWGNNTLGTFQNKYVADGNLHVGFGDIDLKKKAKRVCPLSYSLTKEQFDILHARFPEWLFDPSTGGHDHPIAHTSAILTSYEIMTKARKNNTHILDLNGNPASNARLSNADCKISTCVREATPKDGVRRVTKWGKDYVDAYIRDVNDKVPLKDVTAVVCFHTLYYYSFTEITNLLINNPDCAMTATMHRFVGSSGKINGGEQTWVRQNVNGRSTIIQTNVETGETYTHDDNEHWFLKNEHAYSDNLELMANDKYQSLAWTINKACEDTFVFTIAAIRNKLITASSTEMIKDQVAWHEKNKLAERAMVTILDQEVYLPYAPQHAKFHDKMRQRMMNKPRNAKTWAAHNTACAVQNSSMMKGNEIDTDSLHGLALSSFWWDHKATLANDSSFTSVVKEFHTQQIAYITGSSYFTSKRCVSDLITFAISVVKNHDKPKDLVVSALSQLNSIIERK